MFKFIKICSMKAKFHYVSQHKFAIVTSLLKRQMLTFKYIQTVINKN